MLGVLALRGPISWKERRATAIILICVKALKGMAAY